MSTSVLKQLINSTAESNVSMRKQIREQQMSLLRLEQRVKQRKFAGNEPRQQLKIPPGKMLIKAKGMYMRVRNDKAILDELSSTRHHADSARRHSDSDEDISDKSPVKFDSKTAPNLIIQSSVQNAPVSSSVAPPPPHIAAPPPSHAHTAQPVYYQHPPPGYSTAPVILSKHYLPHQPVQYVEEYVQEAPPPPTVYKVRKPYPRSYSEPVLVYPDSPNQSRDHYRPVEYKPAPYPTETWHSAHSPRHSAHSPRHSVHSPPPRHHDASPRRHRAPSPRYHDAPRRHEHVSPRRHQEVSPRYKHSPGHYQEPVLKEEEEESWSSTQRPHYVDSSRKRSYPGRQNVEETPLIRHDISKRPARHSQYRVLVSNLHPSVTLLDIEELFSAIDTVEHIQMLYPGVAEVMYAHEQSAAASAERYHNRDLDGQPMQISYSAVPVSKQRQEQKPAVKQSYRREQQQQDYIPVKSSPQTRDPHNDSYNKRPKTRGRVPHSQHQSRGAAQSRGAVQNRGAVQSRGAAQSRASVQSRPQHSDTESSVHSFTVTM